MGNHPDQLDQLRFYLNRLIEAQVNEDWDAVKELEEIVNDLSQRR